CPVKRRQARGRRYRCLESTAPVPQEHSNPCAEPAARDEISPAVAVEIANSDIRAALSCDDIRGLLECSVAVGKKHRNIPSPKIGRHDVEPAVSIQVGNSDALRIAARSK